jgi:hypothetical protein
MLNSVIGFLGMSAIIAIALVGWVEVRNPKLSPLTFTWVGWIA